MYFNIFHLFESDFQVVMRLRRQQKKALASVRQSEYAGLPGGVMLRMERAKRLALRQLLFEGLGLLQWWGTPKRLLCSSSEALSEISWRCKPVRRALGRSHN